MGLDVGEGVEGVLEQEGWNVERSLVVELEEREGENFIRRQTAQVCLQRVWIVSVAARALRIYFVGVYWGELFPLLQRISFNVEKGRAATLTATVGV